MYPFTPVSSIQKYNTVTCNDWRCIDYHWKVKLPHLNIVCKRPSICNVCVTIQTLRWQRRFDVSWYIGKIRFLSFRQVFFVPHSDNIFWYLSHLRNGFYTFIIEYMTYKGIRQKRYTMGWDGTALIIHCIYQWILLRILFKPIHWNKNAV